jgi:hypothetical protein
MSRKYRATEISGTVEINSPQHMKAVWFCDKCHGTNFHYKGCNEKKLYAIPASAEPPRRKATKRVWDIFKKQFVYARPSGYWFYEDKSVYAREQNKLK